ncbi:MAG: SAM-dependent methyltransferase [Pseudomonadota bacterium]|nr:SAM-dependent methyltransferase [Pseudomonadota bacterium]MEC9078384.1 SAM-dependent methyltransferase [Pseudomonadota bacterium]
MSPLEAYIKRLIKKMGPIPVSQYMALALGHPKHGYYHKQNPLGANGDFITSPEISQVFGEICGMYLASMWQQIGRPSQTRLVELGPGRGTLISDILRAASFVPNFLQSLSIHLVETSRALRTQQENLLKKKFREIDVNWHLRFDQIPEGPVLLVANEFFDALPAEQFVKAPTGWNQRCVGLSKREELTFSERQLDQNFEFNIPLSVGETAKIGDIYEICFPAHQIIEELSKRIGENGIGALVIDYGHIQAGLGDTLQAVSSHQYVDPLISPGDSDLTTHVDFSALHRIADLESTRVSGPINQGSFLESMGIVERTEILARNIPPNLLKDFVTATKRLTEPKGMGSLFKVMVLTNSQQPAPPGFSN